jgi:parafibromin
MADHDPLVLLRQAISGGSDFVPSASDDPTSATAVGLAQASHLAFPGLSVALPISASTRFVSSDRPVDLRSIYFAWLNRERAIPEYNAAATALNDELPGDAKVQNLGFIERLDLITWLEGASEESEYIRPLAGDKDAADGAAGDGSAAGTGAAAAKPGAASGATQARAGKGTLDPRLASVYNGERKMGDRNTVLRGIKPTVSRPFHPPTPPYCGRL